MGLNEQIRRGQKAMVLNAERCAHAKTLGLKKETQQRLNAQWLLSRDYTDSRISIRTQRRRARRKGNPKAR